MEEMSQRRHIASVMPPFVLECGVSATPAKDSAMATGTVKFFNTQKGFGFIQPDDGGKDVFVHISAVERAGMGSLAEGQKIKFEVTMDRGKPAATNLSAA